MIPGRHPDKSLGAQAFLCRTDLRHLVDRQIQITAGECGGENVTERAADIELHARMGPAEFGNDLGQYASSDILSDPDTHTPGDLVHLEVCECCIECAGHLPGHRDKPLSCRGRNNAPAMAREQSLPDHRFELLQLQAGRGLGSVDPRRSGGDAACLDDGEEGAQKIAVQSWHVKIRLLISKLPVSQMLCQPPSFLVPSYGETGMTLIESLRKTTSWLRLVYVALVVGLVSAFALAPGHAVATGQFVLSGLLDVTPIVVPGILIAAWIMASGASDRVAQTMQGRTISSVVLAAGVGAVTPVCGVTVLPLMAGLLAGGVPLAPVMAFWLSSPITDPAMLSVTVATLGWEFTLGKTIAAVGLGLFGGFGTAALQGSAWTHSPLRRNRVTGSLGMSCGTGDTGFRAAIWAEPGRRTRFFP